MVILGGGEDVRGAVVGKGVVVGTGLTEVSLVKGDVKGRQVVTGGMLQGEPAGGSSHGVKDWAIGVAPSSGSSSPLSASWSVVGESSSTSMGAAGEDDDDDDGGGGVVTKFGAGTSWMLLMTKLVKGDVRGKVIAAVDEVCGKLTGTSTCRTSSLFCLAKCRSFCNTSRRCSLLGGRRISANGQITPIESIPSKLFRKQPEFWQH